MTAVRSIQDATADLAVAQRVLRLEAESLTALSASLDARRLGRALDHLMAVKGRVVVTGMGKSGHIARKIAATLASTGTPALFVHPAEASHGDLGMIAPEDGLIALSNSGSTAELSHVIAYAKRMRIPLVAITSGADSALAESADVVLALPRTEEACPLGLAPTTSTTMMLGLAMRWPSPCWNAAALPPMISTPFTPAAIWASNCAASDQLMHAGKDMPLVAPGTAMSQAIIEMTAKRLGCVGVAGKAGPLEGVITDGDLRRHMATDLLNRRVEEIMTRQPRTIRPQATVAEAVGLMTMVEPRVTTLFVVEGERPVGLLHIHDCLRAGAR